MIERTGRTNDSYIGSILSSYISIGILAIALVVVGWINISTTLNEKNYHEEHRSLYIYAPRMAIEKDYVGEFLSSLNHPPLYEIAIWASHLSGFSLSEIHKFINISMALLLMCALANIGYLIFGAFGAVGVALLGATQTIYFYQINSSTEHAMAFPLLAWGGYALYTRRYYLHAMLALVAGVTYPPVGIMLGATLATHLVLESWQNGRLRVLPYKTSALLLVGFVSVLFLYLQLQPLEGFGKVLAPGEQPEYTSQGRLHVSVYSPSLYIFYKVFDSYSSSFSGSGILAFIAIEYSLFLVGLIIFLRTEGGKFFVLGITVSCMLIFLLFFYVKPAVSYRFFIYPVYTAYPLYIFIALKGLATSFSNLSDKFNKMILAMFLLFWSLSHDFSDEGKLGYEYQLTAAGSDVINFFKEKKGEYLVAAWPLDKQTDLIPYLTGQPQFVSGKGHIPYYEGYVLKSRERMNDFIRAYFAKSYSPIALLHCKYDIDYFVVNERHFESSTAVPRYFSPFDELISELVDETFPKGYLAPAINTSFIALEEGEYLVVDLRELVAVHSCES